MEEKHTGHVSEWGYYISLWQFLCPVQDSFGLYDETTEFKRVVGCNEEIYRPRYNNYQGARM
jgi:hypothetical protein